MLNMKYLLALDQGTTSSRAIIFDGRGRPVSAASRVLPQIYPQAGWVEHDPCAILGTSVAAAEEALERAGLAARDVAAMGIANQRETAVLWEKSTGRPVCNAIVWQCRRTSGICERLKAEGMGGYVRDKTGLLIDAYFSATKIKWALDNIPGLRGSAENGEILFGTVDSWLIWNLTGGEHVTDVSNASRTMLYDIDAMKYDAGICRALGIPECMLPEVRDSNGLFGVCRTGRLAGIPICASAGDQAAALFGQACFEPGMAKNTYGTGCFTLVNLGGSSVRSAHGLLTSAAWTLGGKTTYALEGSAFNAGTAVQWLRDEVGLVSSADEMTGLARSVPDSGGVYFVPAFTGLGAPYWDMYARGGLVGLTRGSGRAQICRAVLESIAYQVADLAAVMSLDGGRPLSVLRADGGASVNDFLMSFQAGLLGIKVDRPKCVETTAFGAAALAGLYAGVWSGTEELSAMRETERVFEPDMDSGEREWLYFGWKTAVKRMMTDEKNA